MVEIEKLPSFKESSFSFERSKPILEAYLAWLQKQRSRTLPKSLLGQAIAYSLNQWDKLTALPLFNLMGGEIPPS